MATEAFTLASRNSWTRRLDLFLLLIAFPLNFASKESFVVGCFFVLLLRLFRRLAWLCWLGWLCLPHFCTGLGLLHRGRTGTWMACMSNFAFACTSWLACTFWLAAPLVCMYCTFWLAAGLVGTRCFGCTSWLAAIVACAIGHFFAALFGLNTGCIADARFLSDPVFWHWPLATCEHLLDVCLRGVSFSHTGISRGGGLIFDLGTTGNGPARRSSLGTPETASACPTPSSTCPIGSRLAGSSLPSVSPAVRPARRHAA